MKKSLLLLVWMVSLAFAAQAQEIVTIQEVRERVRTTPGEVVTITGIITTGPQYRGDARYIQDETAGLLLYAPGNAFLSTLMPGDSVTITGKTELYFDEVELVRIDENTPLTGEVIASDKPLPEPIEITADQFTNDLMGQLVRLNNALITDPRPIFEGGGSAGNFAFTDSLGNTSVIRIANSSNTLVGNNIPRGNVDIIGVLSKFGSNYQVHVRGVDDIIVGLTIDEFAQQVGKNRLNFSWTTPVPATTALRYKRYDQPDEAYDTVYAPGLSATHNLTLYGLEPAQFYNVEAFSITADNKKAQTSSVLYATESESTGEIDVYFNFLPDQLPSGVTIDPSNYLPDSFDSLMVAYIDRADFTIDVAIYNVNPAGGEKIIQALNRARQRGVRVRYITDPGANSYGPAALDNIPVLTCECPTNPDGPSPLMHNKFLVIDAASALESYVISGSANWTDNNLFRDPNNIVVIQDQAIARAYTVEFEEMWGGSGLLPDRAAAAFGADKENNVPHRYLVGGDLVELYFSPSDATNTQLLGTIANTNSDIRFALADITRFDLTEALIEESETGWSVIGLVENSDENSSERLGEFFAANVEVIDTDIDLHHKFMVVDALRPEADPLVVTGSHNWSTNAETRNDENVMIIHDEAIATAFLNQWRLLYYATTGREDRVLTGAEEQPAVNTIMLHPNPTTGTLYIQPSQAGERLQVQLVSLTGQLLWKGILEQGSTAPLTADLSALKPGMYLLQMQQGNSTLVKKVILK